jgi:hypothetical protein
MDGKRLSYALRNLLNEEDGSNQLDAFTTFDLLNDGAAKLNRKLRHITADQSITTVADQSDYTLDAEFITLYREETLGKYLTKYSDGTTMYNLTEIDDDVRFRNQSNETVTSQSIPSGFSVMFDQTEDSQVTGTATSTVAKVAGKTTLNDTAADFSDVSPGDTIHNTSDGSLGVVLSKTSSTVLVTALFGGTANDWTSTDAYVIQPQARYKIVLNPPPSTTGHTITVPYIKRPKPVYSDYDMFMFPNHFKNALLFYAAGFYKYRESQPNEGNVWFGQADLAVKEATQSSNKTLNRRRVEVNFKRRQRNS